MPTIRGTVKSSGEGFGLVGGDIAVGIAVVGVAGVRWVLVSASEPTIDVWCPQTVHPETPVVDDADNVESRAGIVHWLNLGGISLIDPNPGGVEVWASGWPRGQDGCWDDDISPPLIVSWEQPLECRSDVAIVIRAADAGEGWLRVEK